VRKPASSLNQGQSEFGYLTSRPLFLLARASGFYAKVPEDCAIARPAGILGH
jgi:hypothetical protein